MKNIEMLYKNYNFASEFLPKAKRERIERFLKYCENANGMTFKEASEIIANIIKE